MDTSTGEIMDKEAMDAIIKEFPEKEADFVEVNDELAQKIKGMNRKGRRTYLATLNKK